MARALRYEVVLGDSRMSSHTDLLAALRAARKLSDEYSGVFGGGEWIRLIAASAEGGSDVDCFEIKFREREYCASTPDRNPERSRRMLKPW